jgi:hypothetical protein
VPPLAPQRADCIITGQGVSIDLRDHMAASLLHVLVNRQAFDELDFVGTTVLRPNAIRHRRGDIFGCETRPSKHERSYSQYSLVQAF